DNTVGTARADGRIDHVLALPAERSIAIGHAGISRTAIFDATRAVIEARLKSGPATPDAGTAPAKAQRPAGIPVAVLPFTAFGDTALEAGADGLVEDLITALAQAHGLAVASRMASFQHRGVAGDIKRVGAALGVRFIVEGSVRRVSDRVRVA